jgi:hypothetical protein
MNQMENVLVVGFLSAFPALIKPIGSSSRHSYKIWNCEFTRIIQSVKSIRLQSSDC